jgi:hypothetical protein
MPWRRKILLRPLKLSETKQSVKRRVASSGMLRLVALVRTDVSEKLSASIIRVTRIDELGTLDIAFNRSRSS